MKDRKTGTGSRKIYRISEIPKKYSMKRKGGNMVYICKYKSPLGDILLAADEIGLTGLWFEGQNYFADTLPDEHIQQETEILTETKKMAGYVFRRGRTEIYSASSSCRIRIQTGGVENLITGTLRSDDFLRRNCPKNG